MLVSDSYFEKRHYLLKILQTVVAIFSWLCVVAPFIWILLPFISPENARENHILVYKEEMQTLKFLFIFLCIMFVVIEVIFVLLTIWSYYKPQMAAIVAVDALSFFFKNLLQKSVQYDEERLDARRQLLKDEYDKRFGPEEFRREVCYYSVKEEQNLDTDFVRNLYKKGGVKL